MSYIKERMSNTDLIETPNKDKIQCATCIYADRTPISDGDIVIKTDRIDYDFCKKYFSKPSGVLFPLEDGKYQRCPNYQEYKI